MTPVYSETPKIQEISAFEISTIESILKNSLICAQTKPPCPSISFQETVKRLKTECTYDSREGQYWSRLIEVTSDIASHVLFVIEDRPLSSTTFAADSTKLCHYFNLFSVSDTSSPFLTIRADLSGDLNELTTVASNYPYIGNRVQEIADNFMRYIGIKNSYVHDDSTLWVGLPSEEKIRLAKISLRRLTAIATDSGTSFYEKMGFEMANFKDAISFDGVKIAQNREFYFAAVEKVRNTALMDLLNFGIVTKPILERFALRYLESKTFDKETVHDLAKVLLEKSKKTTSDLRLDINADLLMFQQKFLSDHLYTRRISHTRAIYNLANEIIRRHFILKKEYSLKTSAPTFLEYCKTEHKNLDELAKPVIGPKGAYWDDIVATNLFTVPSALETSQSFGVTDEEVSIVSYDSPEEFFTLTNSLRIPESVNSSKNCWITIPDGWNGNQSQKMTYLFLTFEKPKNGTEFVTIQEMIEEDALAHSIDDQPILARSENREIKMVEDGKKIDTKVLKEFISQLQQQYPI